nr:MAG TPA: hypothetical protein [Microviridae sp.]
MSFTIIYLCVCIFYIYLYIDLRTYFFILFHSASVFPILAYTH